MKKNTPKFFDDFFYYSPYFHDGAIIGFRHMPESYILEMESMQLYICENKYLFPLSERNTLYGFLHIEGVKTIICDAKRTKILEQEGEYFGIHTFDISNTQLRVTGAWMTVSGECEEERAPPYCIIIEAEKIYWENTADCQKPEVLGSYLGLPKTENYTIPDWYHKKFGIDIPVKILTKEVELDLHTWHYRRKSFRHKETKEELDFDKGQFGLEGYAGADHYHRRNPKRTNRHDECLDRDRNPCGRYEDRSHFSPQGGKIWK